MFQKSLLGVALTVFGIIANADTLLLDGLDAAAATATVRPARGLTMTTVESQFGIPTEKIDAIGEPPISRWEYPAYTVFFEFDHVIHSISRR